jgi:cytochrome b subunit of formate dehydrogenase
MRAAEWSYRVLLRAYPAEFRAGFEREMVILFHDRVRECGAGHPGLWIGLVWDVAQSAPALRVERMRAWWHDGVRTTEGTMRPMAILAVLVGAIEAANGLAEAWAGGIARGDGPSVAIATLVTIAAALLVVSGVAMLRGAERSSRWARWAAIACLVVFAFVGLALPRLSHFAMLLGIAFPIALLVFLRVANGRSTPTMA